MQALLENIWYKQHKVRWLLLPFSYVYLFLSFLRRKFLLYFCKASFPIPIIVVGNITVGGTGKTPLVIALANALKEKGHKVGIVSRGYKASLRSFPYLVQCQDSAEKVGDEPLLIARKTLCPVVIALKRNQAIRYLLDSCTVIISDDGLQHYAMPRDIEIVLFDGQRGKGNGLCLPAGPLRERLSRLHKVDFVLQTVTHSSPPISPIWKEPLYPMQLVPGAIWSLTSKKTVASKELPLPLAALAGIGNPQRFWDTLSSLDLPFTPYAFADHHSFFITDLPQKEKSVIMTEKDAVKCETFALPHWYVLPVEAQLSSLFWEKFWSAFSSIG